MQWSSWSKHVFERDDSHAISCAISRQEKDGLHKCIVRFITYSSPGRADTWFPSLPRKECTGVRYVITKFSRMDGLPNFLTHGASLARFARWSSAIRIFKCYYNYQHDVSSQYVPIFFRYFRAHYQCHSFGSKKRLALWSGPCNELPPQHRWWSFLEENLFQALLWHQKRNVPQTEHRDPWKYGVCQSGDILVSSYFQGKKVGRLGRFHRFTKFWGMHCIEASNRWKIA